MAGSIILGNVLTGLAFAAVGGAIGYFVHGVEGMAIGAVLAYVASFLR